MTRGLAFGLLVSLGATLHASEAPAAPEDVSAVLPPLLEKHKLPGMAILVLQGDRVVAQGVAGVRLRGGADKLTLDDKFHLGSDTKAMTATTAAMFVEEEKLNWTTTLGTAFGGLVKDMNPAWKDVTLRQLLAHRAGLAGNPDAALGRKLAASKGSPMQQRRDLAAGLLSQPPEIPPGTKYSYANNGFMLAGAMVEQLAGLSWENVARERLFKPLGITTGGFGAPQASLGHAAPRGHRADGTPVPANADNPAYYGPAGTAHMTIGDWAKFVGLHLRGDPANPNAHAELLKPATFARLHTAEPGETYAFGWGIGTRPWAKGTRPGDVGRTLSHSGSNTYWYCTTWVAPEIDFAFLVTCNQGGDEAGRACDEAIGAMIRRFVKKP